MSLYPPVKEVNGLALNRNTRELLTMSNMTLLETICAGGFVADV